eukprot:CAMPEP_0198586514 /NCGR_PEP_ID=MMETSP1462-20131121/130717_1 /TAXON_ID=1333877 /ORGANISM="Brandtodinium nutriculum, Strain RCC3387" /LENGTH=1290 /DNA_ID=CAMNT_0044317969 /DNA_START=36 /DNA_END=3905 /DNA_ORIENTATION=-
MAKFAGSQDSALLHICVSSWHGLLDDKRLGANEARRKKMEERQQQQYQRALDTWAKSSNKAMLASCFAALASVVRETRDRARLEAEEAERRKAVATRTCAKLIAADGAAAMQMCFVAWIGSMEEDRMQAERERLEALQQQQYERALACWANGSDKVLRTTTFGAWSALVYETKMEREKATQERAKRSEGAMKALAKFCAAEGDNLLRMSIGAWHDALQARKNEEIEGERERMKALQRKQFEGALGSMAQSSERVLRRTIFVAWAESVKEARKLAEEKAKRSEVAMRSLTKFIQAEGNNLMRLGYNAWHSILEDKRMQAIEEQRLRLLDMQQKQFQGALGCMAQSSERVLRRSAYISWVEAVKAHKAEMAEKAKASESAMKTVSKMLASEGQTLYRLAYTAWHGAVEERRKAEIEDERAKMFAVQQKQFQQALGCMAQSSERALRRSSFFAWRDAFTQAKLEQQERARRSEAAMKALSKFCASQSDSLCRVCYSGWRGVLEESVREAIAAERTKMVSAQQAQFQRALQTMAGNSDRKLRDTMFIKWKDVWTHEKEEKAREFQEQMAKSENALRAVRSMMASEGTSLLTMAFHAWKDEHAKMQKAKIEEEQRRLKDIQNKHAESALGAMAKSSDRALKATLFAAWDQILQASRKEAELEMQQKEEKMLLAKQTLQKMMSGHEASSIRVAMKGWRDAVTQGVLDKIKEEKDRMKDAQRKQFEGALRCMTSSSERAMRSSAFVVWRDVVLESHALREAEMEEKAKANAAAIQALVQVIAADQAGILRMTVVAWKQVLEAAHREKLAEDRKRMKALQLKNYEKAMGGLAQSNNEVMLRSIWSAWHLSAKEAKEQRDAQLKEKAKRSEQAMKALSRFVKNDAMGNLRLAMGAWAVVLEDRRKEKIEAERHRMRQMNAKNAERALGGMAQNSEGALLRTCFFAWQNQVAEDKRKRQAEVEAKAKQSEVAMRSLAKFCQANDLANLQMCVGAWVAAMEAKRKEALQAEREKLSAMQKAQFDKTAGCLAQSSERGMKGSCFGAWCEALRVSRMETEEKAKRSAVAMKSLAKFCDSQSNATLSMCVGAWSKALEESRREKLQEERNKMQAAQKQQYDRAMKVWAQSSSKALRKDVFAMWFGLIHEAKVRKELDAENKAKRSAVAMKSLSKFVGSQTASLLQMVFSAWHGLSNNKLSEAAEKEIRKLQVERAYLLSDRTLRSLSLCRLGARQRTRRGRMYFVEWADMVSEAKGRVVLGRGRDRSLSPAHMKASRHTTVGTLLASAQAEAQARDHRMKRRPE